MNYTSKGKHVPQAERNNHTIGERICSNYHNLPYKAMAKIMLKYLAMVCTHQSNLFPPKGSVSAYLSPNMCEHIRSNYHNLPYKAMPKIMLKYLQWCALTN
jgi:hypothetical protein